MEYNEKIHAYIERAFSGLPDEERVQQTKDELYSDLLEKYQTLINEGASPMSAYNTTIGSIGDIFELVDSVGVDIGKLDRSMDKTVEPTQPIGLNGNFLFGIAVVLFLFYLAEMLGKPGPKSLLRYAPFAVILIILCALCWTGARYSDSYQKIWKPDGFPNWYGMCVSAVSIVGGVSALLFSEKKHLRPISWLILIAALAINSLLYLLLAQKNDGRDHS